MKRMSDGFLNNCNQHDTESIDVYVGELRLLAKTCNFGTLEDSVLLDRIVCGITDQTVQKRLLQNADLKLKSCIDMCCAFEATVLRLHQMGQSEEITVLKGCSQFWGALKSPRGCGGHPGAHRSAQGSSHKSQQGHSGARSFRVVQKCKFCSGPHAADRRNCPAWERQCYKCKRWNHFAASCSDTRSNMHHVDSGADIGDDSVVESAATGIHGYDTSDLYNINYSYYVSDDECNFMGDNDDSKPYPWRLLTNLEINGKTFQVQLDTGATVNVLNINDYEKCWGDRLDKSDKMLSMFNNTRVKPLGHKCMSVFNPATRVTYDMVFQVVSHPCSIVLSMQNCLRMGSISVNTDSINIVDGRDPALVTLVAKYPQPFDGGEGCFPGRELPLETDNWSRKCSCLHRNQHWHWEIKQSLHWVIWWKMIS